MTKPVVGSGSIVSGAAGAAATLGVPEEMRVSPEAVADALEDLSHALAPTTERAFRAHWRVFESFCRRTGIVPLPCPADAVALFLSASVNGGEGLAPVTVASAERRLTAIVWFHRQAGRSFDRNAPALRAMLAGLRRRHSRRSAGKAPIMTDDLKTMLGHLPGGIFGLRDRAILLLGFAGGLRRSEIVCLDLSETLRPGAAGCLRVAEGGILLTIRGKTGLRDVEIARGERAETCPVAAVQSWLSFARISEGPVFRRIQNGSGKVLPARLSDKHVARLVKHLVAVAGIGGDLPEAERLAAFSGHSLRVGLASSVDPDNRHLQKHLGHASPQMTALYRRNRTPFRVNMSKAAGL